MNVNEAAGTYSVWPVLLYSLALWLYFTGLVNLNRYQRLFYLFGEGSVWARRSDVPDDVASWLDPLSSFRAVFSMVMLLLLPATPFLLWGPDVQHPLFFGLSGAWLMNVSMAGLLVSPLVWWSFLPVRVSVNGMFREAADLRNAVGSTSNYVAGALLLAGLSYVPFVDGIFDFITSGIPAIARVADGSGFADRCVAGVAIGSILLVWVRVLTAFTTQVGLCCAWCSGGWLHGC